MTHADQILIEASTKIREQVLTTADDLAYYELIQHLRDLDIWSGDLEALTGIDSRTIRNKYSVSAASKAVEMGRDFPQRYKDMAPQYSGKPLAGPDYEDPDWQSRWLEKCPAEYRTHVLEKALIDRVDAVAQERAEAEAMHWIVQLYQEHVDRYPDPRGLEFWLSLLAQGHSEDAVRGWILNGFTQAGSE